MFFFLFVPPPLLIEWGIKQEESQVIKIKYTIRFKYHFCIAQGNMITVNLESISRFLLAPYPHGACIQGWGFGLSQKPDPWLFTSKQREIFKILLNKYFRSFVKPSFLYTYFLCQTSPVSPRVPDPVRILPDPGWFLNQGHLWNVWNQKYENKKRHLKLSKIFIQ